MQTLPSPEVITRIPDRASLKGQKVLFIDCQTTGATPATAHILELGWAIGSAEDTVPPAFTTRLVAQPDGVMPPPRIQKITGIDEAAMAQALAADVVAAELKALIDEHKLTFAVAHWAQFEKTFLTDFWHKYLGAEEAAQFALQYICTCQIAKRLYPDLPSRAIRAVGGFFGLDIEEMKRSGGHVETTYFIWQKLAAELDTSGLNDTDALLDWLKPVPKVKSKTKKAETCDGQLTKQPGAAVKANYLVPMERLRRLDLPDQPGVYRMLNSRGKILYVGKATSLKSRVNSYFTGRKGKASKTKELISQVFDLHVSSVATPLEAALLENDLIKEHDPPYNRALKKRNRSLLYFNYHFDSMAAAPDAVHRFGPYPGGSTIQPLIMLVDGAHKGEYDLGLFWGLLDAEQTARAAQLFFAEHGLVLPDKKIDLQKITVRNLIALGLKIYRRDLLECLEIDVGPASRAARRNLSLTYFLGPPAESGEDELEQEVAVEVESLQADHGAEDNENLIEEMTDEDLLGLVRGIVTGSARTYAQAKTIIKLMDATVQYEEKKRRRRLVFSSGAVAFEGDLDGSMSHNFSTEGYKSAGKVFLKEALDIATYDRMRVLLAEIRRLYNRGHKLSLEFGQ